ncbi:Nucleotide diphospho-sugar transferase [Bathycoccus prasinos]|uniref:Glycosyltransferase n=1 Tax=Bathycoccus prasinos TaxID=41875 RepID=K8ES43_9CHLO|nr:Nucleotide diphospho-sugar transferase [Bathycoccus prasinos]CCO20779.1 Nucleotide diphospho-sugar transferase [Bathycoccus prasinos]|eukprot:XP_007508060.1 Nucleotide diphospho-sugar transferase [Bathycoccus prasinos]
MNATPKSTCEILFVSVVIFNRGTKENVIKSMIDQVTYHHKSIDEFYQRGESCKVLISDDFTKQHLEEVRTSFQLFQVNSSKAFSSISKAHPWLEKNGNAKTAMINGCPLPRMQYVSQFLTSLEYSQMNIVFIDTDTLILGDLREIFITHPDLDLGFTMGGHYVKKQDPNHFINVGVIFISENRASSKFLSFVSEYCTKMSTELSQQVILDQYSTFQALERYKVETITGSLMGRKLVGDCVPVKFTLNSRSLRVYFLSEEYNTPGRKLYKTSRVAHFAGGAREKMLMISLGKVLLREGVENFKQRYAHRTFKKSRVQPNFPTKCTT